MRLYIIVASVLSGLFGLLPLYMAKYTNQGDELCAPELFYSGDRVCILLWDRSVIFFRALLYRCRSRFRSLGNILEGADVDIEEMQPRYGIRSREMR